MRRATDHKGVMRTKNRSLKYYQLIASFSVGALVACSETGDGSLGVDYASTGLQLKSDILADTDAAGVRFDIQRVDCVSGAPSGDPLTSDHDLEDILIPGGITELEGSPLDKDSGHLFADHFETLAPGCYDVTTTPLTASGEVSEDCTPAFKKAVGVNEGVTTEIFLINQCSGSDPGGNRNISFIFIYTLAL